MRFEKILIHLPKRCQCKWFLESFFISILFILFLSAFFYVACGKESGIQQPVFSVSISSSSPVSNNQKKSPSSRSDFFSLSFLGWHWEISRSDFEESYHKLSEIYQNYGILIPAKYRAAAGSFYLLWQSAFS